MARAADRGRAAEPGGALRDALARAGDGAFVVGADGRIAFWNRAAERILGYAEREVVGRPCCELFAGCDDRGNRLCYPGCHVLTLVRMGEPVRHFEMGTRTKEGRPVWLDVSVLAWPAAGGPVTVHLFRDVTATKALLEMAAERRPPPAAGDGVPPAGPLTRRETEVLRLLAAGAGTKAVAERLHISPATVRNHVQNIFGKLGVHSRLEAAAYAHRHRLV